MTLVFSCCLLRTEQSQTIREEQSLNCVGEKNATSGQNASQTSCRCCQQSDWQSVELSWALTHQTAPQSDSLRSYGETKGQHEWNKISVFSYVFLKGYVTCIYKCFACKGLVCRIHSHQTDVEEKQELWRQCVVDDADYGNCTFVKSFSSTFIKEKQPLCFWLRTNVKFGANCATDLQPDMSFPPCQTA